MDQIKPISSISESLCKNLEYIFTDIDDTITECGKLPPETIDAIWKFYKTGINIVPVTGRPAGWCDHIARMWPVAGVIGENGAFYYSYDQKNKKFTRKYLQTDETRKEGQLRLNTIKERALKEVPGCAIASDQPFRVADLAIDFAEDAGPLNQEEIDKICKIAEDAGATCKVSSIHINCWYGSYDKLECFNIFLKDFTGKSLREMQDKIIYIGDSQNDEPMFEKLKNTIAVANIKFFFNRLKYFPTYITEKESAQGFHEASEIILKNR